MIPGDPVRLMLSIEATDEDVERFRQTLGYDKPIYHQYFIYLKNVVTGDLGTSLRARRPVMELIIESMPATIELAFAATIISVLIAVPLGTMAAYKRGTAFDRLFMFLTMIGQSMPIFWLGILLILLFSVQLGWLPTSGRGSFSQLLLPSLTLSTYFMALIARMTRSSVLEVLGQPYILTAVAKGLQEHVILFVHTIRNALIPVVTVLGLQVGSLLSGSVITETIFAWPGIGRLAVSAIYNRDYPLIQGTILISAAAFVIVNLIVDLSYLILDPKIKYQ
jgi:peptide/nickel transport system permease protein